MAQNNGVPASPSGLRPDGLSQSSLSQAEPPGPNAAPTGADVRRIGPRDYPVSKWLVLALDDIRTRLHEHDGNRLDCIYCRIFDHVNAAFGEAVGEAIAIPMHGEPQ